MVVENLENFNIFIWASYDKIRSSYNFFSSDSGHRPATLLKKRLRHWWFLVKFA